MLLLYFEESFKTLSGMAMYTVYRMQLPLHIQTWAQQDIAMSCVCSMSTPASNAMASPIALLLPPFISSQTCLLCNRHDGLVQPEVLLYLSHGLQVQVHKGNLVTV